MSKVVREKDNNTCFTCGSKWWTMNAGHRHHGKLSFDFRNIHCQCVHCNLYLSGNLWTYERNLIEKYWMEWTKQLERDAWKKWDGYSIEELEVIIKELTELYDKVKNKKLTKKEKEAFYL